MMEFINKLTLELEEQEKLFPNQVNAWDKLLQKATMATNQQQLDSVASPEKEQRPVQAAGRGRS